MKRRNFFRNSVIGMGGIMLPNACTSTDNSNKKIIEGTEQKLSIPNYIHNVKDTFTIGKHKNRNDTVVVGQIGVGGWGNHFIQQLAKTGENVFVKYICDVDDTRGGSAIVNIHDLQGVKPIRVRDMRIIFDDKEVDAVIITTPQHWHALATIWACQAGKDVYVEKCISHTILEGQKMIEATMKYERIVQCGTHNNSGEFTQTAKEYIRSGELGELVSVHIKELTDGPIPFNEKVEMNTPDHIDWDLFLGPAPKVPYSVSRNKSWGYYWDYSGGLVFSNGVIHQVDLARNVLGYPELPVSAFCAGGRYFFNDKRDIPDYQIATLDHGNFVVTIETGECTPYMKKTPNEIRNGDGFPNWNQNATDILILGTKKMMRLGRMGGGWQVFDESEQVVAQGTGKFALIAHQNNFLDSVRTRKKPNSDIVEGHKSSVLMHLGNISYRLGRSINFSPEHESIVGDHEASQMETREYRNGFELPSHI